MQYLPSSNSALPLSPAVVAGDFVFVSGQIPRDAQTGALRIASVRDEVDCIMSNLLSLLQAAGGVDLGSIVKCSVYLSSRAHYEEFNAVFQEYFPVGRYPARTTICCELPNPNIRVEIDAVAYVGGEGSE